MKREPLSVVHEDNVEEFLARIGIVEDIRSGTLTCHYCEKQVTLENFLGVAPKNKEMIVACKSARCYHLFVLEFFGEPKD